jgi:hypothetical protein
MHKLLRPQDILSGTMRKVFLGETLTPGGSYQSDLRPQNYLQGTFGE